MFEKVMTLNIGPASEILKDDGRIVLVSKIVKDDEAAITQSFKLFIEEDMNSKIKQLGRDYKLSLSFDSRTEEDKVLERLQKIKNKRIRALYIGKEDITHLAAIIEKEGE